MNSTPGNNNNNLIVLNKKVLTWEDEINIPIFLPDDNFHFPSLEPAVNPAPGPIPDLDPDPDPDSDHDYDHQEPITEVPVRFTRSSIKNKKSREL